MTETNQEINTLKKAFELSEEELKNTYSLLSGEEQTVLNVLMKENMAVPVKEIRGYIIDDLTTHFASNQKQPLRYFKLREYVDTRTKNELGARIRNIPKKPNHKRRAHAEKAIKQFGVANIPSFETIERILQELIASGLVIKRTPATLTKTKALYAPNPKLIKREE